ncbi:MAG: hypothetical protein LBR62_02720, partial [Puniceicoccales bacterium]|nr:hypothetical protein [Puniceicoccales bacterium]
PIGIPPHPLFEDFARDTRAVSLGHPGETHALEFEDGKILFGYTHPMETVRYATILKTLGESGWVQTLQEADIVAFQNWTMVIHMTEIVSRMAETILPQLSPSKDREWFFDLADPQKRSPEDLRTLLGHLKSFESYGRTTLSLNRGEADRVGQVLHLPFPNSHDRTLDAWLYSVRKFLAIECVSLHHAVFSACATSEGIGRAESSKILHPVCLTGSGDHFNAGYLVGRLLGLKTEDCLRCGNAFAGTYIELGRTPELAEVEIFLKQQSYGSRGIDHVRGKRRVRENHANQPNGSAAGRPRPTRSGHP